MSWRLCVEWIIGYCIGFQTVERFRANLREDPKYGQIGSELVERSMAKEWSFWREHVERSNRWSVVTIGVNVWSDPKCGHLRED